MALDDKGCFPTEKYDVSNIHAVLDKIGVALWFVSYDLHVNLNTRKWLDRKNKSVRIIIIELHVNQPRSCGAFVFPFGDFIHERQEIVC